MQKALSGGDFWLWKNQFGMCVGGTHPLVTSFTTRSDSLFTVLKVVVEEPGVDVMRIPTCSAYLAKASPGEDPDFSASEQLGTFVEPRCPIPGI